jgi:hypothetical protein
MAAFLAGMDSRIRGNDAKDSRQMQWFSQPSQSPPPDLVPYQSNLVTLRTESVTPVQE